jgi:phosphoribosylaminoimidazole-succinocarboxamide synthase
MLTRDQIAAFIPNALDTVDLPDLVKQPGKVRDSYALSNGRRMLITTDRISAFDRVLGLIPFRGQILNQLSAWWFDQTRDLIPNHLLAVPDPNVTIAREAAALPIEIIARGYITGVTSTSLWTLYADGERAPYGIALPDGLHKNDPLPHPILTPTTKAAPGTHDAPLTREQIIASGLLTAALWDQIEATALALFARGQEIAGRAGLILVDTKYELGLIDGVLTLIDEVHTPDSSRYWDAASYTRDPAAPDHYDKEFLRHWYAARGYRGDGDPPALPADMIAAVAERYLTVYERLTGQSFVPGKQPAAARIALNVAAYLEQEPHE